MFVTPSELLAALDATPNAEVAKLPVTAEQYNTTVTELHAKISRAHSGKDSWKRKAQELEASRDEWKARAERWAESKESWKADAAEWQTRAEKAEATVAKVNLALSRHPEPCADTEFSCGWKSAVLEVVAAVTPAPAFTLPTEAGARFEATMKQDPAQTRTFTTYAGTDDCLYSYDDPKYGRYTYTAAEAKEHFTDHRLLGADQ